MTRPILVFGAGGRVGGELFAQVKASHCGRPYEDVASSWVAVKEHDCNITNANRVKELMGFDPRAIVNLAACTLPRSEQLQGFNGEAFAVNAKAMETMAALGIPLVFISTDCVFDGMKDEPYTEGDARFALNWYGHTKLLGEDQAARAPAHIIIRTTGVYLRDKPNFLKLVLDKARAGESMDVIADTLYSPTDARELAKAILTATERVIEDPSVSGTYHFAGPDHMSYLDFAKLALEEAGLQMEMKPVTLAEREAIDGFKRPRNASLNSDKFAEVFGLRHRPTRECLRELVQPRQ